MRFGWTLLAACIFVATAARAETIVVNPDNIRANEVWERASEALERGPVEIVLEDGVYYAGRSIRIRNIGHDRHTLVVRAQNPGKAVIRDHPDDENNLNGLFYITDSRNVVVRDLLFTGPERIGFALRIANSQDVTIDNCAFEDLHGAHYAAISVIRASTDRVTIRRCRFVRVGLSGHAHMIYSAYNVQRLSVIDSYFEDCAGDFVRFRDETDFGVVYNCVFKSTGTYRDVNPPMIAVPLFNDDNPADPPARPNYEYFGTNFVFANNSFEYGEQGAQHTRFAVVFHHSGYDPPERNHLLSPEEAELLARGPTDQRKKLLLDHMGIDVDRVHVYGNTYKHVEMEVAYRSYAAYGAESRGWKDPIDISDLMSHQPVINSIEEALEHYR